MKIGINASFLRKPFTGIGQYTKNLINSLLELETAKTHQFFLYFEEEDGSDLIVEAPNLVKKVIKAPLYKRDDLVRKTLWEASAILKNAKKDKLEAFFSPYNAATFFSKLYHVMTLHDVIWKVFEEDYANNIRKKIYFKKTYQAVQAVNQVITVSEFSKKEIVRHLNIEAPKIKVIKNGVGEEFLGRNERKMKNDLKKYSIDYPYLFYLGGLEKRKNVELLLRAFQKLALNYPNILENRKLIIGAKPWKEKTPLITDILGLIKFLNLEDQVDVISEIEDEEKPSFYSNADLFIFPSIYEGFGLPVLEAMTAGCPVLASNASAIPEVGKDSIFYFNPLREDELIQQMIYILSNSDKREEFAKKALKTAQEFSWKKAAEQTLELITNRFN
jgi:glycosyltransferase involved in cell wall biosynthesis